MSSRLPLRAFVKQAASPLRQRQSLRTGTLKIYYSSLRQRQSLRIGTLKIYFSWFRQRRTVTDAKKTNFIKRQFRTVTDAKKKSPKKSAKKANLIFSTHFEDDLSS